MTSVLSFSVGFLLALTTATQLRPLNMRVGVAELGLAAVVAAVCILALLRRSRMGLAKAERFFGVTLFFLGAFLGLGTLWGIISTGGQGLAWATGLAYVLSASALIALWTAVRHGWLRASTVIFGAAVSTLLISFSSLVFDWLGVGLCSPWYDGDVLRFTACSENPNQLGLLLAAVPFFLLDAYRRARSFGSRLIAVTGLVSALAFGIASGSDAMVVGWLVGGLAAFICWLASIGRQALPLLATGVLLVFALLVVIVAWRPSLLERGSERVVEATDAGGQASTRFELWSRGLESVIDSKLLGWGPGAYSLADDEGIRQEAHNTLIDWATQSGLGGVVALCGAWAAVLLGLYRRRETWLLGAAAALCAFAVFHFVLRQPAFWVLLVLPILTLPRWPVVRCRCRRPAGQGVPRSLTEGKAA